MNIVVKQIIVAISVYFYFSPAWASEKYTQVVNTHDCDVAQVGWGFIKEPLIWKGNLWNIEGKRGCEVKIAKNVFEKDFDMCYLTGVDSYRTGAGELGSCGFNIYDNHYMFEWRMVKKSSLIIPVTKCTWVCQKK